MQPTPDEEKLVGTKKQIGYCHRARNLFTAWHFFTANESLLPNPTSLQGKWGMVVKLRRLADPLTPALSRRRGRKRGGRWRDARNL